MTIGLDDFLRVRHTQAVADVRAPSEFSAGHIPGAVNIPLLNDAERIVVGTAYKQRGQQEAIREGFRLVGPRLGEMMEAAGALANGKEVLVHCWRGGMRSNNFCAFAAMAGIKTRALHGGYKVYRSRALDTFCAPLNAILITGYTGSGKSEVLQALKSSGEQIIDLEMMARHKGSAFGGLFMPEQPTTEQFQNELFETLSRIDPSRPVWIEDESLSIGRIFLPVDFWNRMKECPLVELSVDKEIRIGRLVKEYGEADPIIFLGIMTKLIKRLGGQHFLAAKESLLAGDMPSVMSILLTYYDKAYREGLERRRSQVTGSLVWNGNGTEALAEKLITLPALIKKQ